MKHAAYILEMKRTEDFYELMNDLLDESERALEQDNIAWCAVVHRLLLPVVEQEVGACGAPPEASSAAA